MNWGKLKDDVWLVRICGAGVACFIACYAVAIALYPGGTWWDPEAEGHSLTRNFLCDLMQTEALNGVPAPVGSPLARFGMFAMLVGLVAFYVQVAKFESPVSRAGRIAQGAGLVACVLGLAVPIVTSGLWRLGHIIAVVAAFLPSLIATIAALVVCLRAPGVSWLIRAAGIVTLGAGAVDGFAYLFFYASPVLGLVPESMETRMMITASLPLFQRVATAGIVAWATLVSLHTLWAMRRE